MTNPTLETLKTRRSCRAYKPQQISEEELSAVLEAGTYAPTAMGREGSDPMYGAPTYLLVLADAHRPTAQQDGSLVMGSLVMGNLMNAAASIGLGSCWINRAREMFDSAEGKALLAKWGIAGDWQGVGFCILGYPAADPKPAAPRKADYIVRV